MSTQPSNIRTYYELNPTKAKPDAAIIKAKYGSKAFEASFPTELSKDKRCGETHPKGFICTRTKNHGATEHEAHVAIGVACAKWYDATTLHDLIQEKVKYYRLHGYGNAVAPSFVEYWAAVNRCGTFHKKTGHSCSLVKGHPTEHQAHYDKFVAATPPYSDKDARQPVPGKPWAMLYTDHKATDYCSEMAPDSYAMCTRPKGHADHHESASKNGLSEKLTILRPAWTNDGDWVAQGKPAVVKKHGYPTASTWVPDSSVKAQFHISPGDQCGTANLFGYNCTRQSNHDGPHEAHTGSGQACGLPWVED